MADLRSEIEALKSRQKAVEDLQTDRNIPVYLLNELVKQTPEGVYLKQLKQDGNFVLVTGYAQTNERVSEFLRNTAYSSTWLERPDLLEIKAISMAVGEKKDPRKIFEFSIRLGIKRPAQADEAASGASRPASAPKASAN